MKACGTSSHISQSENGQISVSLTCDFSTDLWKGLQYDLYMKHIEFNNGSHDYVIGLENSAVKDLQIFHWVYKN